MADRQKRLLALIEAATGKAPYTGSVAEEGEDVDLTDDDALRRILRLGLSPEVQATKTPRRS